MSTATDSPLPLAKTLDETLLRGLFAGAPDDLSVPEDIGAIRSANIKSFLARRRSLMLTLTIVVVVIGLIALLSNPIAGLVVLGVGAIGLIIPIIVVASSADDQFFDMYATARGLTHSSGTSIDAGVPLFSKGDKRSFGHTLRGSIGGVKGCLGHYTYTEVSTDSEGNRTESDSNFTVLTFKLPRPVADRFVGVYLSPKKLSLGALQDKLAHDRKVQLESAEFASRYTLRVVDEQDDIALYELFSTTFVQHLATDLKVYWEQRGEDLVFWRKGHEGEAADLDSFCNECRYVLQRYLDEYR